MPIITMFGTKGGTGRTTAATAIARGMLARGLRVTLVETQSDDQPLARWCTKLNLSDLGAGDLFHHNCTSPSDIDLLMQLSGSNDQHAIIFDTASCVSAVRTYAFELADVVLMPFTGFLDAEDGISKTSAQVPRATDIRALSMRATEDLSENVAHWIPMVPTSLPYDERLVLFSDAEDELTAEMATTDCTEYNQNDTLANRLIKLALEAHTFAPEANMAPIKRPSARALLNTRASLRVPA